MPTVTGFVNPIGRTPAFLIPLFREHATSNQFLVQSITGSDTVAAFAAFNDFGSFQSLDVSRPAPSATVGGMALWAFSFDSGEVLLGTADEIRPDLERRLRQGDLTGFPLLETEVAEFCGADDIRERALRVAYQWLGGRSSVGAGVWRDVVILRPTACSDLADLAKKAGIAFTTADLDTVEVNSTEGLAEVRIPLELLRAIEPLTFEGLRKARALAAVFDLNLALKAASEPKRATTRRQPTSRPLGYPFAAFVGPGLIRGPSKPTEHPNTWVGPFGKINERLRDSTTRAWSGQFVVLRNSERMLSEVSTYTHLEFLDTESIGIVVQRAGFGSPQRSTVPVADVTARLVGPNIRPRPAGVFYVGGHVLQRPLGMLPELNAADRGRALALSAASAVMALAYATGAKSARELLSRTRRARLGLALRRKLKRDETPFDALRVLLSQLLHPEAHIARSGEISLVISPSLGDAKSALVEKLIDTTQIDARVVTVHTLPAHRGQPQISLVAKDVPFEPPSGSHFSDFCRDLLAASGWIVEFGRSTSSRSGIVATREGIHVFFISLVVAYQAELAVQAAHAGEKLAPVRCIITNFTPSGPAKQTAGAAGCWMVHYSRISEWFDFEISGRAGPRGRRW